MSLKNKWIIILVVSIIFSSIIASGVTLALLNTPWIQEYFRGPQGESLIPSNQLTEFEQELQYYHLRIRENGFRYYPNATSMKNALTRNSGPPNPYIKFQYVSKLQLREYVGAEYSDTTTIQISFKDELIAFYAYVDDTGWRTLVYCYWSPRGPISAFK